ncbi:NCS2 family permease [Sphingomonas sp.]|uniref:NCS2 family permease n=1 Tax=Sphingomonas sp. TaxID=28214 RepID=UPI0031DAE22B
MHGAMAIEEARKRGALHGVAERLFRLRDRGSTPGREALAGLTSFATMAFILVVNPVVMAGTGMDKADLVIATAAAAAIGSLLVAFVANQPLVAAPAMGSNVVFATVLVGQLGVPWRAGLAMVLATGLIFLAVSLSRLREAVVRALPSSLQVGIQASVGVLILLMALRSAHVLERGSGLPVYHLVANLVPGAWLALAGMVGMLVLIRLRVPAALLVSIVLLAAIGLYVPDGRGQTLTQWPTNPFGWPHWPSHTALQPDFAFLARNMLLCAPLMLYFFCSEFFSTMGTVIGAVGAVGGEPDADGAIEMTPVFVADALATIIGPLLGTSVVTVFVESVAGIQVGGRTGLTALVAALCFMLALVCGPLLMAIPAEATAPAMMAIGLMMLRGLHRLDWRRPVDIAPAIVAMTAALVTGNLINSIAAGTAMVLVTKRRGASPLLWAMGALFATYYLLSARFL